MTRKRPIADPRKRFLSRVLTDLASVATSCEVEANRDVVDGVKRVRLAVGIRVLGSGLYRRWMFLVLTHRMRVEVSSNRTAFKADSPLVSIAKTVCYLSEQIIL